MISFVTMLDAPLNSAESHKSAFGIKTRQYIFAHHHFHKKLIIVARKFYGATTFCSFREASQIQELLSTDFIDAFSVGSKMLVKILGSHFSRNIQNYDSIEAFGATIYIKVEYLIHLAPIYNYQYNIQLKCSDLKLLFTYRYGFFFFFFN